MINKLFYLYNILLTLFLIESKKYTVFKNVNLISEIDTTWLINSINTRTKMSCLAQCNLNDKCSSLIFKTGSETNKNCLLYTKHFDSLETISCTGSELYVKESKYRINYF
jgi:hypothetical protein